jgi:hypothetical protein
MLNQSLPKVGLPIPDDSQHLLDALAIHLDV